MGYLRMISVLGAPDNVVTTQAQLEELCKSGATVWCVTACAIRPQVLPKQYVICEHKLNDLRSSLLLHDTAKIRNPIVLALSDYHIDYDGHNDNWLFLDEVSARAYFRENRP